MGFMTFARNFLCIVKYITTVYELSLIFFLHDVRFLYRITASDLRHTEI
jgi:hypothetical protein